MNCLQTLNQTVNEPNAPASGADKRALTVAAIGSGGKTTFLRALADEAVAAGKTAVLATTTHFLPFEGIETVSAESEFEVSRRLAKHRVICAAQPTSSAKDAGKLGPSPVPVERLAKLPDYLLVEADGSRRLPFKAHAEHEPVVPAGADAVGLVVGSSGFGKPVSEVAHRSDLFCERAGCAASDPVTPVVLARLIMAEIRAGIIAPTFVVVNQAEDTEALEAAAKLKCELADSGVELPLYAGSVRRHQLQTIG